MYATQKTRKPGLLRQTGLGLLSGIILGLGILPIAQAVPKQIIILRHGEKQDDYRLCSIGQQRSLALQSHYLGKGAANRIFPADTPPSAIFAITLHTLELVDPTAQSWGLPIQLYSVTPASNKQDFIRQLNQRTQQAARDVLTSPQWDGKTVVMVWEHDHIAKQKLEKEFPDEKVTLRQLLHLDQLPKSANVPDNWDGNNYDYFWIIDYATPGSDVPTGFTVQKQTFPSPYQAVPDNDWGKPERLPEGSGCRS